MGDGATRQTLAFGNGVWLHGLDIMSNLGAMANIDHPEQDSAVTWEPPRIIALSSGAAAETGSNPDTRFGETFFYYVPSV